MDRNEMADPSAPKRKNWIEVNGVPGCLISLFVMIGSLGGVFYLVDRLFS
jgi:hypothetical protein